jgi:AcrR family transcriptional regulator
VTPRGASNGRERPAKPALTRKGIIATATAVMRAEGGERVTMRRLAKELGTGPASLYVYVKDTDDLHAAVLDELLAEVDLAVGAVEGGWRERLWTIVRSYSAVLHAHPSLARAAQVTPVSGPNYLAMADAILALLGQGGMAAGQAAWAADILLLIARGGAVEHGARRDCPSAGGDVSRGTSGSARARWAFDALLDGALETSRPPAPEHRARPDISVDEPAR